MILIEVNDAEFRTWLTQMEYRIQTMVNTLMSVAQLVELNTQRFVPYNYDKPWGEEHLETSFVAVPTGEAREGFIEVEVGYSAIDPRDGYDYAEYVHTGIDWRTGSPLNFQKSTAQAQYLWKGLELSEEQGFREIETDYLSLFRGSS